MMSEWRRCERSPRRRLWSPVFNRRRWSRSPSPAQSSAAPSRPQTPHTLSRASTPAAAVAKTVRRHRYVNWSPQRSPTPVMSFSRAIEMLHEDDNNSNADRQELMTRSMTSSWTRDSMHVRYNPVVYYDHLFDMRKHIDDERKRQLQMRKWS
jgi:hypothetical protein